MYWDDAVIFGLVTVGLVVAFMAGWVGFVIHDHKRHGKHGKSDQGRAE
ncbi:hypothetical protein IEI94_16750 [Halomonas sp. ML-15]|nr:cytochrome c oxidase subunit CcoM [Halomonas sp. ML-15]MBD3897506.1 hypothetical protein [Halomonas sp. ML-15]